MSQETLGYVKLEWTCPKCQSRVPGPDKTCPNCGAPQPENVEFVQALGETADQDEELRQIAAKGADKHCPFCGTRNFVDAIVCSQCGGSLEEGKQREVGRIVGAYSPAANKQINCPKCGSENPIQAKTCSSCGSPLSMSDESPKLSVLPRVQTSSRSKFLTTGMIVAAVIICLLGIFAIIQLTTPQEAQRAQVDSVGWKTAVQILGLVPISRSDWQSEIPENAPIQSCDERVYQVSNAEPYGEKYNKICGTPYTIDTGTGIGQVVRDCQFEILRPYCKYSAEEWQVVDTVRLQGQDLDPVFANPSIAAGQQMGDTFLEYWVVFTTSDGQYTYKTADINEFQKFSVDSKWLLEMNALNQILSIESME